MKETFIFRVPNSLSLNKLRTEMKEFLKRSKFLIDPSDLRKGTLIRVELKSKSEFWSLLGYCIKNQFNITREGYGKPRKV